MKIAVATPILAEKTSPFNHLFRDILNGFLDAGHEVIRFAACRKESPHHSADPVVFQKW